jgi:mannose-6-phosphate isomerase-like protein (cupin superfamily)
VPVSTAAVAAASAIEFGSCAGGVGIGTEDAQDAAGSEHREGESMKGYVDDIEQVTTRNTDFRRVLYTGAHLQLVLMTLLPGEEIGEETHPDRDQFFRIEAGEGAVLIDGKRHAVRDDFAIIVPAGARHNVVNTGAEPLKLYTLYGPPEHRDEVVHRTKADAEAEHEHFDGRTTE